ncbi:hypothetical protein GCM10008967_03170 [Bacillus carboniphilus]|uniref:Uncharacterized protein n=1 Tax=Bacillus carboniphilus TaxID=86663 RepID=A0ABN0VSS1_9BACI
MPKKAGFQGLSGQRIRYLAKISSKSTQNEQIAERVSVQTSKTGIFIKITEPVSGEKFERTGDPLFAKKSGFPRVKRTENPLFG